MTSRLLVTSLSDRMMYVEVATRNDHQGDDDEDGDDEESDADGDNA